MNKQQLAAKIWESANKMRSKIEAHEYKDYILGFIFYKFLSEAEVAYAKSIDFTEADLIYLTEEDPEIMKNIKGGCGYFIAHEHLFQTWIAKGSDFEISNVRDALSAFDRNINPAHKHVFDGIFETLQTGLSKLGSDSKAQTKAARDLIYLIKDIPMDGRQDYDVLGFIYEYLISNFAANAGKKAGEFYTPHEVSKLMSEIIADHLQGRSKIEIYDPTSGSGSLLINIGQAVARRNGNPDSIKYYAQELKENTYNLTRMNLIMRGIKPANIITRNGDTLEDDWPWFDAANKEETYEPLFVDAVVSNPPYSQHWDPEDKENDLRYTFGLAPKSKADYAFLLHDLYHLRNDGIMTIVLPHGVLFRGGEEGSIRKNLLEHHHIQAIIGLPANIFFGTGIPTIIMVLRKDRPDSNVLIVDASKHFAKEGKNNKLQASDIKRIVDVVTTNASVDGYSRLVSLNEIRENDYNLNIPRYVDSGEAPETWDLYSSMFGGIPQKEIKTLEAYWKAWPSLKDELFSELNTNSASLKVDNVRTSIKTNKDVKAFVDNFTEALKPLSASLKQELLTTPEAIDILSTQDKVAQQIIDITDRFDLIDGYAAYQRLDDVWADISIDMEIIQSEGFAAVSKVDPNMIIKKVKGKEAEVQDGWTGRILPFPLVQKELLYDELAAIEGKEQALAQSTSKLEEIIANIPEDERDDACLNDDASAFQTSDLAKRVKLIDKNQPTELEEMLLEANKLIGQSKTLKSEIKSLRIDIEDKSRLAIESLDEQAARDMLRAKWIVPLCHSLQELPHAVIDDCVAKVESLTKKYNTTYAQVCAEISEAESQLAEMIDQLVGNEFDMAGLSELKALLGGE